MIESPIHVQVDEVYPVPCIYDGGRLVPVWPKPHADNEPEFFVNVVEHYHVDNRFIEWEKHTALRAAGKEVVVQERACLFVKHEPPQDIIWMHLALLNHFKDHKLKNCHVCPHKGMPIINGVCMGHGLKWNAEGYLKHRGPFTLDWFGNTAPIENLKSVRIPIIKETKNPLILNIMDSRGELVFTHYQRRNSYDVHAAPGDVVIVNNDEYELHKARV